MNIGNGSIEARREILHQTLVGDRLNIIVFKHGFLRIEILVHQFQGICKPMIFSRQVVKANPNFFDSPNTRSGNTGIARLLAELS